MADLSVFTLALRREQNPRGLPRTPLLVSDRFYGLRSHVSPMQMLENKSATSDLNIKIDLIGFMARPFSICCLLFQESRRLW